MKDRIQITDDYRNAEIFLGITRWGCHERPGVILHTVSRQGVPLLYVIMMPGAAERIHQQPRPRVGA